MLTVDYAGCLLLVNLRPETIYPLKWLAWCWALRGVNSSLN